MSAIFDTSQKKITLKTSIYEIMCNITDIYKYHKIKENIIHHATDFYIQKYFNKKNGKTKRK